VYCVKCKMLYVLRIVCAVSRDLVGVILVRDGEVGIAVGLIGFGATAGLLLLVLPVPLWPPGRGVSVVVALILLDEGDRAKSPAVSSPSPSLSRHAKVFDSRAVKSASW
jgi:hypothetical protein